MLRYLNRESRLTQDVSVGTPEAHAGVGQMAGGREVHRPWEMLPSLVGCGEPGWGLTLGRTFQAATACYDMKPPWSWWTCSVIFMVGLSDLKVQPK